LAVTDTLGDWPNESILRISYYCFTNRTQELIISIQNRRHATVIIALTKFTTGGDCVSVIVRVPYNACVLMGSWTQSSLRSCALC